MFGTSASFSGTSSYISTTANTNLPSGSSPRTFSAWVSPVAYPNGFGMIVSYGNCGTQDQASGILISNTQIAIIGWARDLFLNFTAPLNGWTHIVATYDSSHLASVYANGNLIGSATFNSWNTILSSLNIGRSTDGQFDFDGRINEVAIWSRSLSAAEVFELYRRGANRIKYQIRTCPDATCSAGSPTWQGPDNSSQSYFAELNNTFANAVNAAVQPTLPSMLFSNFINLIVPKNHYFQYRAIMESDDTSTNCNYGSGPTQCSPELKSVTAASHS